MGSFDLGFGLGGAVGKETVGRPPVRKSKFGIPFGAPRRSRSPGSRRTGGSSVTRSIGMVRTPGGGFSCFLTAGVPRLLRTSKMGRGFGRAAVGFFRTRKITRSWRIDGRVLSNTPLRSPIPKRPNPPIPPDVLSTGRPPEDSLLVDA